jgi:NADH:ubiquinone oxidoreductase subunit 6 (subunit J)
MLNALLVAGAVVCAIQAIRATRLLVSALWLAGVSALVAIALYRLGAQQVAVVELSVGAGLVTVLFVFAISIAGDDAMEARPLIPIPLALGMVVFFAALLGWMVLPITEVSATAVELPFASVVWGDRALDVLLQVVMIFTGVLCLLGLLSEGKVSARREIAGAAQMRAVPGEERALAEALFEAPVSVEEPVLQEVRR